MDFDALLDFLDNRLRRPLPGLKANERMMPRTLEGKRLRMRHDAPPRDSAVMILLMPGRDEVCFPLIQRPNYPGVHSGQMALPGGRKESEDPDLIFTALRETEEEIGVKASDIKILGTLSSFFIAASNYQVLPTVAYLDQNPTFIPEKKEVAEVVTARVSHLVDDRYVKEKEIPVGGNVKLWSPYFELERKVVWGATAMMLNEFRVLLKENE